MSDFIEGLRQTAAASLFPTEGELSAPGLREPATVARDTFGVPHIQTASPEDLWFVQGLVTAGERLFQLDLLLRASTGRLSEVFGERTLPDDRWARTIGFHVAGRNHLRAWTDQDHAMHTRFRQGVLAWVEQAPAKPVEYTLLDFEPEIPDEPEAWAAAFAFLAWGLSNNWDKELLRARLTERLGPETADLLMPPTAGGNGLGSNDWAVAGSRTTSGKPLLANDPHLLALQPGAWIELHLSAPGYTARGVALTFSPGILLGATPHHAWGVTNVSGDVQDLYEERLDPDGTAAGYEGAWEPLTLRPEPITVRGEPEPIVITVRETRHGPLLDHDQQGVLHPTYPEMAPAETYALRWVGRDHGIRPSLTVEAAAATDFTSFRRAALQLTCPGQNFVYADVDGTIGYQCTGLYPVRRAGDGTRPVPGWTSEHEWDGFVPVEVLPHEQDPARGWVATANHRVHGDDYPHLISQDFHEPWRFLRIAELLSERDDHDVTSMTAIQTDTVSLVATRVVPLLIKAVDPHTDDHRAALETLGSWDGDMRADSAAAAIYHAWCAHIARRALENKLGGDLFHQYVAWGESWRCSALPRLLAETDGWVDADLLRAALTDALTELRETLGEQAAGWRWGALHRLALAHPLASIPGLEPLFVAARIELGGDEQTVAQAGYDGLLGYEPAVIPSWRAVWDLAHLDRSVGVVPTGVSGNPASAHWNDQAKLYADGETKPTPLIGVEEVATLRLTPTT